MGRVRRLVPLLRAMQVFTYAVSPVTPAEQILSATSLTQRSSRVAFTLVAAPIRLSKTLYVQASVVSLIAFSFALFQPCIVFKNWPPIESVVTNKGLDIAAGHTSDVVYNSVSNLWSCCSYPNGTTNCELPTDDTFAAISPEEFSSTATSSSSAPHTRSSRVSKAATNSNSAPAASTSPSSSISGSSNTATPPPASNVSSGLSTGAKAGIGVGCGILGVAVLTGVVFLVRRRSTNNTTLASSQLYEAEGKPKEYYATAGRPGELSAENHSGELASQPINELA